MIQGKLNTEGIFFLSADFCHCNEASQGVQNISMDMKKILERKPLRRLKITTHIFVGDSPVQGVDL